MSRDSTWGPHDALWMWLIILVVLVWALVTFVAPSLGSFWGWWRETWRLIGWELYT